MKPITLHPGSLLAGIGVAVLAFVAMGQSVVQLPPQNEEEHEEMLTRPPAFAVHPRDWVQIREGMPYTVPQGKIFALTALGSRQPSNSTVKLVVNGQTEATAHCDSHYQNDVLTVRGAARGFAVPAGSILDVQEGVAGTDDARAWGFLADE